MRIAVPCSLQTSISLANCSRALAWSLWKLPGLILTFSTCGATSMAVCEEKWISATIGTVTPSPASRDLMALTHSTSDGAGTVRRIICAPAALNRTHWATVASTSLVWVLHIVWTTIGLPPPIRTSPALADRIFICYRVIDLFVCFMAELGPVPSSTPA